MAIAAPGRLAALLAYDPTVAAQAESELERLFLDLLRAYGIAMPQVNVLVDGYLVDAYWPEANLVVELDGYEFHHDREAFERDRRKLAQLAAAPAARCCPLTYAPGHPRAGVGCRDRGRAARARHAARSGASRAA